MITDQMSERSDNVSVCIYVNFLRETRTIFFGVVIVRKDSFFDVLRTDHDMNMTTEIEFSKNSL